MCGILALGRFVGVSPSSLFASSTFTVGVDFLPIFGEPVESVEAILDRGGPLIISNRGCDMMRTILGRYAVLREARLKDAQGNPSRFLERL